MLSHNADLLAFKLVKAALSNPNFPFSQGTGSEVYNAKYIAELTKHLSEEIQQQFDDFNQGDV